MTWLEDRWAGLPVRVQLPRDYQPTRRWPLVVFLHGSGERGDDNRSQLAHGVRHFEGLDAIVAAPQCPREDSWGGTWFGGPSRTQAAVVQLVGELRAKHTVDPKRVVLIGASMGAIGGWEILARHPGVFDAAALLCGEPDVAWAPLLQGQRIWSFHGEADQVVPIDKARALHQLLPAPARFTSLPGRGHDIWDVLARADLYRWLLSDET
jgi:predicted peptidase